jgi:hypothetical protein
METPLNGPGEAGALTMSRLMVKSLPPLRRPRQRAWNGSGAMLALRHWVGHEYLTKWLVGPLQHDETR